MADRPKGRTKKRPATLKPLPMAYHTGEPCEHCGCDWRAATVNLDAEGDEIGESCANQWCRMIQQLRAAAIMLAKLAADEPQFDNPLHVYEAQRLRDSVLRDRLRLASAAPEVANAAR